MWGYNNLHSEGHAGALCVWVNHIGAYAQTLAPWHLHGSIHMLTVSMTNLNEDAYHFILGIGSVDEA